MMVRTSDPQIYPFRSSAGVAAVSGSLAFTLRAQATCSAVPAQTGLLLTDRLCLPAVIASSRASSGVGRLSSSGGTTTWRCLAAL